MLSRRVAILEGMPEPRDLRMQRADGRSLIFAGTAALFRFADGDTAMRNMALAALRQLGFPRPAGRGGAGADAQLRGDAAPAGAAGGDGGAGPAARAGPAR